MFPDFTSISSGTPCGSSVSAASGPPGFAATAITGHSLNLANRKKNSHIGITACFDVEVMIKVTLNKKTSGSDRQTAGMQRGRQNVK